MKRAVVDTTVLVASTVGDELIHKYTLVGLKEDSIEFETFKTKLYPRMKDGVCTSAGTKIYRDHGTKLSYDYYTESGRFLGRISIDTKECQKN